MTAAEKIIEYVRRNHNSRSDELMKLIAEYDAEREPEPIISISEDGAPIFEYKTGTVLSVKLKGRVDE